MSGLARRRDDVPRRGRDPAGRFKQRLADLPAGMERGGRSLGCEQQRRGLQLRPGWRRRSHGRAGHGHDAARFLAAGGDHRLARFEADAAGAVSDVEGVGGQIAIGDVLGEPAAQFIVGNGDHFDRPGCSATGGSLPDCLSGVDHRCI